MLTGRPHRERRIKCDTTKPTCNRCKQSGRECGGYTLVFRNVHATKVPENGLSLRKERSNSSEQLWPEPKDRPDQNGFMILEFPSEENSPTLPLKFFLEHSIPELFTRNQEALWKQSLGSRCTSGSAVYHAALAVSYAHDLYLSTSSPSPKSAPALEHYQVALSRTNAVIADATHVDQAIREDVALTCILFICFELLSGHDEKALYHLEGGLKIVHDFEASASVAKADADAAFVVALSKTFLDLDLQALAFLGWRRPRALGFGMEEEELCDPPQMTAKASREELNDFLMGGHRQVQRCCYFMRNEAQEHKYDDKPPEDVESKRRRYLQSLKRWARSASSMLDGPWLNEKHIARQPPGPIQKLMIALLVTFIKLSCCLTALETSYDEYEGRFFEITELAEAILNVHAARKVRKRFTLHCSVVEPLYFTACKCRNPAIRRRAISQLRRAGQQGGWNGSSMANVAEEIVKLEEEGGDVVGLGAKGIKEEYRIHGAALDFQKHLGVVRAECFVKLGDDWNVKTFQTLI